METELELKAVVPDPVGLRRSLQAAGARETFRGMLRDRRLDATGRLTATDTVLRLRRWVRLEGGETAELGWKGPASVSAGGYKRRQEIECTVGDAAAALTIFQAIGFEVIQAIDRFVEVYDFGGAVARVEWYPRMDVLVEIEGQPAAIESLIATAGLARTTCTPDPLSAFVGRYEARTGRKAALAETDLAGEPPSWATG